MVDHLDDLEADFQAFYGISDIYAMSSARFLRLAERTFAFEGVMAARYAAEKERNKPPNRRTSTAFQQQQAKTHGGEVTTVKSNQPSYLERLREL